MAKAADQANNISIGDSLALADGSVAALAGCGGKTALAERLALLLRHKKVLLSPTTKIFPMQAEGVMLCQTAEECQAHRPQIGIQCMGELNRASGKLEALPAEILAALIPQYDIALLEADGSRGLPCKGWREGEPVIPGYCTHTIGIVTMSALGRAATAEQVHNLPEFLALTGLCEGEPITAQALEHMVCAPNGMFCGSAGRRVLLVNQVEDAETSRLAQGFLQTIKEKYPDRFSKMLCGSILSDAWGEV